jgi:hypothetical protein
LLLLVVVEDHEVLVVVLLVEEGVPVDIEQEQRSFLDHILKQLQLVLEDRKKQMDLHQLFLIQEHQ